MPVHDAETAPFDLDSALLKREPNSILNLPK